jgi:hypothetical protein
MVVYAETYDCDWSVQSPLELGYFNERELDAFSLLIQRRRSLPIYLGSDWRCAVCGLERGDLVEMANHVLQSHQPEPLNEEDLLEMLPRRRARTDNALWCSLGR